MYSQILGINFNKSRIQEEKKSVKYFGKKIGFIPFVPTKNQKYPLNKCDIFCKFHPYWFQAR